MNDAYPEKFLYISGAIGLLGLAIIILGFKFSDKTRKVVETTGAIIFHVGVFGILYYKVSLNLFISLVMLVFSLFMLIDPLKISQHVNEKIYRLFGYIALLASVAFSLDFFSGFPVWLWTIPLVVYLSPYLISSLRRYLKLVLFVAWLVVFSYVGLIGYVIYSKFNPEVDVSLVKLLLPQLKIPSTAKGKIYKEDDLYYDPNTPDTVQDKTKPTETHSDSPEKNSVNSTQTQATVTITETQSPTSNTATTTQSPTADVQPDSTFKSIPKTSSSSNAEDSDSTKAGPYLKGIQAADEEYIRLKKQYKKLMEKYKELQRENHSLKHPQKTVPQQDLIPSETPNSESL